jgi:hypothetical protein
MPRNPFSLHIGASFLSGWNSVLLPWFNSVALEAVKNPEPVVVVTPSPSAAAFLRSKLLDESVAWLGVKFLTPPQLRETLLADAAPSVPLREHLRLLLAVAAESIDSSDVDLVAVAKSVCRAPDNLLRAFDKASAAGWDFKTSAPPAAREIISRFEDLVRECAFQFVHEADRQASTERQKRFSNLLLIGFGAAQWPLWPLLNAAVLSATRATVMLEYPREQTRTADELWIGTWEQHFESAAPTQDSADLTRPFSGLIRSTDLNADSNANTKVHFLIGLNATEQAQAIVAAALKFLADKSCNRLGILFPRSGALPRLVSELLIRFRIPHYDGIGHLTPGEFENSAWMAWLDLQESRQLESLVRFFESNPSLLGQLSVHDVRHHLRRAYRNILIDDVQVLRDFCASQTENEKLAQIAKLLAQIDFLPSKASFQIFLDASKSALTKLKWNERWTEIERFAQTWGEKFTIEFSRATYLRWLNEILNSFSIERAPQSSHSNSRVHLLPYGEVAGQEWSHLILGGLNQGEWPQGQNESGFLSDEQIVDLNSRALQRGKQGEGHTVLKNGKTFLLSSKDERQIALGQFAAAVESVEHGIAITASLLQESAPERFWNPSELFSQIYFTTQNAPLSQDTMSVLQRQTNAWLDQEKLFEAETTSSDTNQTRIAYDARRKAEIPFGEYEFSLRQPIDREITLRATEWSNVVKTPALIWLKRYLGVENTEPDLNQWNLATGEWVHDWLAQIADSPGANVFVSFPTGDEIRERIARAAKRFRQSIVDLCARCGRTVPDWWISGWGNAFALADCLVARVEELQGLSQLATEWILQPTQTVSLNGETKLRFRGRIDLILAREELKGSELRGAHVWIVDYKTGQTRAISASGKPEARVAAIRKKLVRGDAIQLGLYGLAARELGADEIDLSILSLRSDLDKPQLSLDDLTTHEDFWNELHRMQETGIFGLRGAIRNEFGFNPDYPLATLPIDKEFLDEKWVLTHPAFADDEDERG